MTSDLDGVYRLVDFAEIPSRGFTHAMAMSPYAFLRFYTVSAWARMTFNLPPASVQSAENDIKAMRKGRTYVLNADGQLTLNNGKAVEFAGRCTVVKAGEPGFQENDLILSGNETGSSAELHLLYRRWNGEPLTRATSEFDPAPAAVSKPQPEAELAEVKPTLPDEPRPVKWRESTVGHNDAREQAGITVTNNSQSPLSAFMIVYRDAETAGRWRDVFVDACLDHRAAWQFGESLTHMFGIRIAVRQVDSYVGAAIFSDGSTWGNPQRLALLKHHRGNCQWPGS